MTKVKGCKVVGQEGSPGIMPHAPGSARECEGINPHTPKGIPLWELESWWTPECSESDCKGQNPMDWRVIYIIEKLLKLRCLKWAHMTHLGIWNTSYGQKKDRESNWKFDSRPLKVGNQPNLLMYKWLATHRWKAFDKGYNIGLDFISIRCLHATLWAPKVVGVPTLAISGLPLGSLETKCHLDVGVVERHIIYYKGEGGGFSPSSGRGESCEFELPVTCLSTKSVPTMH